MPAHLLSTVPCLSVYLQVFQVRKRDTGHIYAMKVMRKEKILAKDHGDYIRAERDVMTAVFHPYIVTLRYSFQTDAKLYLILDFINGGHLFYNLYRQVRQQTASSPSSSQMPVAGGSSPARWPGLCCTADGEGGGCVLGAMGASGALRVHPSVCTDR
jgi:Protein kinase domain